MTADLFEMRRALVRTLDDRTEHHMHRKFALFDRRILGTGSYDWTRSAEAFNQESLLVTDDERLLRPCLLPLRGLWDRLDPERR
jgi:phosphatidylserine/phosphatidylglycerophosphate/cardiolipin synthase-like enzyme